MSIDSEQYAQMAQSLSPKLTELANAAATAFKAHHPSVARAHAVVVFMPMVNTEDGQGLRPHHELGFMVMNTFANKPVGLMAAALALAETANHHANAAGADNVH